MNTVFKSLVAGFAGAITTTVLHELIRKNVSNAPRLDLLGEEATAKTIEAAGVTAPEGDRLYWTSMAGDIVANTLYYSMAGLKKQSSVRAGIGLGLSAGLGAVELPGKLGLNEDHTAGSQQKRLMTIGLYVIGGLVTGMVMRSIR
jgi:hypothetical protein